MEQNKHPAVTPERIRQLEGKLRSETTKWLFGLDQPAKQLVRAVFTLFPYTDKVLEVKALSQPHVMFIGPTGVGKTDLVESLAMAIDAKSARIQGSPDLMPYHIIGSPKLVEDIKTHERYLKLQPGKVFANIVRIDELNRMRGQSAAAIIEAMEERSVTPSTEAIDEERNPVPTIRLFATSGDYRDTKGRLFFMNLMTQNIFGEEEGTYENPMAILDRITLCIRIERPSLEDEKKIRAKNVRGKKINKITNLEEVLDCAEYIFDNVELHPRTSDYLTSLIRNTDPEVACGKPSFIEFLKNNVEVGDSPRVNFHLEGMARSEAFFEDSSVIRPEHVKSVAPYVLTHRLRLKAGKEFETNKEEVFAEILKNTPFPSWR